jgi:hypothetical protein
MDVFAAITAMRAPRGRSVLNFISLESLLIPMHPKEALVTVEKALPIQGGLIEANRLEAEQESEGDPRLSQNFLFYR